MCTIRLTAALATQMHRTSEMTRVVFYNHTAEISGAEKMLLVLLANLPRTAFELELVCPEGGPLPGAAADLGVPIHICPRVDARYTWNPLQLCRYAWSLLRSLGVLRKQLISRRPDIIHANTVRAGIFATLATAGTNTTLVWHVHDMLPAHPITAAIHILAYSSARIHIVACSAAAAKTLQPIFPMTRRPAIVHNGLNVQCSAFEESTRGAKREELGLDPETFAIGIVGQLTPRKGQLELIHAFAKVRAQLSNATLLICGAPQFNNDVEYLARLRGEVRLQRLESDVRFLGYRTDAREVIRALDLCVVNSKAEPFGLTLIESMCVGTPVVSTDNGGACEIVRHGIEGELVKFGDEAVMISTIVRLAKDAQTRNRYRAAGIARVQEAFTTSHYVAKWCSLYRRLHLHRTSADECGTPHNAEAQLEMRGPQ